MMPVSGGLPAEYQEIEFLLSVDGAYFDLPAVSYDPGDTIRSQVKFRYTGTLTNNVWLMGEGSSEGGIQYEYGYYGGLWWRNRAQGDITTDNFASGSVTSANRNQIAEVDWTHTFASTRVANINFRIAQRHWFGAQTDGRTVYYAKLYKNGELLNDLVPCIRKADGVPGMYDLVGKQFYINSGNGEFVSVNWALEYTIPDDNRTSLLWDVTEGQTLYIEWDGEPEGETINLNGWVMNGNGCCEDIAQVINVGTIGGRIITVTQGGQVRVGGYNTGTTFNMVKGSKVRIAIL